MGFYQNVISEGLRPGHKITIDGVVPPNANKFELELNFGSLIAFHYNPRFDENTVVRNTREAGIWGTEEREGPMPFKRGESFTMTIKCKDDYFSVWVNGVEAHKYTHRFKHLTWINSLEISKDVSVTGVTGADNLE